MSPSCEQQGNFLKLHPTVLSTNSFVTTNVYQQGVICGTCSEKKSCRDPKVFFPQDTMIDMFTFSLHVWNDTFTKDPQQWIWTRESHLTKQAPQTIRSYLFGLARDHLALAITTNVVAWLVGLFWGEKTPKVLSSQHQKKTTKKQDRRNMGFNWWNMGFNRWNMGFNRFNMGFNRFI